MKKIVFFDVQPYEVDHLKSACDGVYDYILIEESLTDTTDISGGLEDAEVISCFTSSRVPNTVLAKFSNLKLIALRSVGFNHIDIEYCKQNGIFVVNSKNYGNMTVAEFAFGLLFEVARKINRAYNDLRNEQVTLHSYMGIELYGKTIGIVGLGAIGKETARIAKGFGMNILGYDIYPDEEFAKKCDVAYTSLDDLLRNSDVISLHAPATKDNFHLISDEQFAMMKPNAIFINTARGELVNTQALYNALSRKLIFGAGLDVLECENMLTCPDYHEDVDCLNKECLVNTLLNQRLLKLDNAIVTPHIAYDTVDAVNRILDITMENISSFFKGELQNSVWKT